MADHTELLEVAVELMEEDGRPVTVKALQKANDHTRPWRGNSDHAETILATDKLAVFVPVSGFDFGSEFINPDLLRRCSEVCMMAGDVDLDGAHLINDEGRDYKVEWIQRLRPANLTLLYAFGITR